MLAALSAAVCLAEEGAGDTERPAASLRVCGGGQRWSPTRSLWFERLVAPLSKPSTLFCKAHRGGKRCQHKGCTKSLPKSAARYVGSTAPPPALLPLYFERNVTMAGI